MGSLEIKSSLILSSLLAGCVRATPSPESLGEINTEETRAPVFVPAPESIVEELGENQVRVYLTDGTGMNLCSSDRPYLSGSFFRVNGQLEFYLVADPSNTRFLFPKGEEFPFDDGLIVSDNTAVTGKDNPNDLLEDFVQFDLTKWTIACPTPQPQQDPSA